MHNGSPGPLTCDLCYARGAMNNAVIRDYVPSDQESVLALNQANVPEVGPLDADKLARLHAEAEWLPVVEIDGELAGFAILLVEGAAYESTNYAWFQARHERFLYVDRIALGPAARGQGLGQRIYRAAIEKAAAAERPILAAEVNTVPPNEPSLRFHRRFGFEEQIKRRPYGDTQEVVMLECSVPSASSTP
ncbi:MAG: GNAT family N-acetyltransferase [Planctomycetota bacterium]